MFHSSLKFRIFHWSFYHGLLAPTQTAFSDYTEPKWRIIISTLRAS